MQKLQEEDLLTCEHLADVIEEWNINDYRLSLALKSLEECIQKVKG
jgi:hypothetical protein